MDIFARVKLNQEQTQKLIENVYIDHTNEHIQFN